MKVLIAPMIETREIETAPGLVFDCSVSGDASAPLVLMLHGFCVSRYFWDNQIPVLAAAGYFAVAPNQRGYAAGARPDPTDFDNYRIDKLIGDTQDIVTGVGHGPPSGDAYGVPIRREIVERTGRDVSFGAVYTTLERLERKGYVSSRLGEPTRERGGRAKRYFRIEAPGVRALSVTREVIANLGGFAHVG